MEGVKYTPTTQKTIDREHMQLLPGKISRTKLSASAKPKIPQHTIITFLRNKKAYKYEFMPY